MLLRVTEERAADATTLHVAGALGGQTVEELRRACAAAGGTPRLDLSALLQADEVGLALLRSLRESGSELVGVSPFVQLLLDGRRVDGG